MRWPVLSIFVVAVGAMFLTACGGSAEQRRDAYLARGKQLLAKKDYSRALLEFRNAAKATPKDAEVYYQIGLAALAASDIQTAVGGFRKTLDLSPKHPGARLAMAQLMAASGDAALLKDAEDQLNELLRETPENATVLNALALTNLKLGKTDEAVENLEKVLSRAPQQLDSSITLAKAKLAQRDFKGAETALQNACKSAPGDAAARIVLGSFYLAQKRTPEAEAEFQQALRIDPKSWDAWMELAAIDNAAGRKVEAEEKFKRLAQDGGPTYRSVHASFLLGQGRNDEAIREFQKLANDNPEDRQMRTQLVKVYQYLNRTEDAEKVLAAALKKNPKDLDALLQRGELYLSARRYPQAEMDLNAVLRNRPESPEVHYILAKLYQEQGSALRFRQEASEALRLNPYLLPVRVEVAASLIAANSGQAALDLLNTCPESQKESLEILVQRNWALWTLGNLPEMRKGIDNGLARQRASDFLIQDGLLKLRTGNAAGARAALEEALKINPSDIRALDGLRQSYLAQKQPAVALQKVKEYAAKQPGSAPVQQFLGTLLIADGQKEEARQVFTAAKAAEPQSVTADLSLVQLAVLDRRWDDARSRLNGISKTNPRNTLAVLWLGQVEQMQGNPRGAIEQYRKVVESDPDNTNALNNLAYLLSNDASRLDEALKYAEKARERAPENPDIADTLGWTYYQKGLYPLAVRHLEVAASHNGTAVWKYHLAMAYAKAGDVNRGRSALEAGRKMNPNLPEAEQARKILAEGK